MIATVTSTQLPSSNAIRHRNSQSVPQPVSPSSPTFRHSVTSSIAHSQPLTPPETSPRYRPKYGKRLAEANHKLTIPLLKDENDPPLPGSPTSPSSPSFKQQTVTFPLRRSEEVENAAKARVKAENRDRRPSIPTTFPLSSPPASPPHYKRKMRPSLEGVFDTPTPKPRNSAALTPPETEEQDREERPLSNFSGGGGRRLPRGENPFFFGKGRRTAVGSDPEPPEAQIDFSLPVLDTGPALKAPELNVTSPTPGPSPSKSTSGPIPPIPDSPPLPDFSSLKLPVKEGKTVTYEDEVLARAQSLERVKSKEEEEADTFSNKGSTRRISNSTSHSVPPSAYNTSRRNSKTKRPTQTGRISPANAYPAINIQSPDNEQVIDTSNDISSNTTPDRPRTASPPNQNRPMSRTSRVSKGRSIFLDANSSRTSIPISAIVNPRPPSVGVQHYDFIRRDEGLYMRDPYRETKRVGWGVQLRGLKLEEIPDQEAGPQPHGHATKQELQTPLQGLLFYPGFLFPPLWWGASFLQWSAFDPKFASEKRWSPWRVQLARDRDLSAKTWRDRCRLMALVSLVTYLPLIALLAVFIPK